MTDKMTECEIHDESNKDDLTPCSAQSFLYALKNSVQSGYMPREQVIARISKQARDCDGGFWEFRDGSILDVPNECVLRHSLRARWDKQGSCWPDEEN